MQIINSDALEALRTLPDCCSTCITSPPYYWLRDYGADGQIGLEDTPEQYIENLVKIFREVHSGSRGCWLLPFAQTAGISDRTLSGRSPTPCRKVYWKHRNRKTERQKARKLPDIQGRRCLYP